MQWARTSLHVRVQLWSLGRGATLWRAAPGLFYCMVGEVKRRSIAAHGPPQRSEFDDKLVRNRPVEHCHEYAVAVREGTMLRTTLLQKGGRRLSPCCRVIIAFA